MADLRSNSSNRVEKLLGFAAWAAAVIVGCYHLGLHIKTIGLPPMGFWETTYVARANAWPNQYQWEHYMDGHDGYGPGYPAFVRPFLSTGLDVYVAHRMANLVAIAATCALVWFILRRQGCTLATTFALTTIVYALNTGSYSVQARPDFLVLLAITSMLALGYAAAIRRLKLSISFGVCFGLLTLAGFFTKGYAAFTAAAVPVCLAVLIDWRRTLYITVIGSAIVGTGIVTYAVFNPLYVMEVFQGQRVQAAASFDWLRYQLNHFAILACGPLLVACAAAIASRFKEKSLLTWLQ